MLYMSMSHERPEVLSAICLSLQSYRIGRASLQLGAPLLKVLQFVSSLALSCSGRHLTFPMWNRPLLKSISGALLSMCPREKKKKQQQKKNNTILVLLQGLERLVSMN